MPRWTAERFQRQMVDILECMASGYNNREIAEELEIPVNSLKSWMRDYMYPMLGVPSTCSTATRRTMAVSQAYERGLLKPKGANT